AADESITNLLSIAEDTNAKIRVALLRAQWYRLSGEPSRIEGILQPAVELALKQPTDTSSIYDLALALDPDNMQLKNHIERGGNEPTHSLWNEIIAREPSSPRAVEARVRLAKALIAENQWETSKTLLDDAISLSLPTTLICHARFLRGQSNAALGFFEDARSDFQEALAVIQGFEGLELAIRFDLAEVLVRLQAWDQAIPHWDFLNAKGLEIGGPSLLAGREGASNSEEIAPDDLAKPPNRPTKSLPAWMATIWLRQAELQALRRDWQAAEGIVYQIREQFPECKRRDEVDYLLARCMVSKAKFDDARQLLTAIASGAHSSSTELIARSWWMVGETYLMQRRFSDALNAYEQVHGTEASEYWRSAARMQTGQCYELLRDPESARTAYQQVLERDPQGAFGVQARERISLLPNPTQLSTAQTPATQTPAMQKTVSTSNASTSNAATVGNKR
ncbi:MAG: tetratricopeptide repeat protein, partial [Planctomycetes bacterium]|nr:tetratricopeptide repeat protein [Planctomycetota bacterium]